MFSKFRMLLLRKVIVDLKKHVLTKCKKQYEIISYYGKRIQLFIKMLLFKFLLLFVYENFVKYEGVIK